MGVTQLKNYHPVTGTSDFLFALIFHFLFIINDPIQMLGSPRSGRVFFSYRDAFDFPPYLPVFFTSVLQG